MTRGGGRNVLVALVAILVLVAFRAPLGRAFTAAILDALTGDQIAFDALDVSSRRIVASGVRIARAGAPLFDARRIDVRYDVRAVVFGGARRYGLTDVELEGPRLWLVRRPDGGFDLAERRGGSETAAPIAGAPPPSPLRFALVLRDGAIIVLDRGRALAPSRRLALEGVALTAAVDGAAVTTYRGTARIAGAARDALAFAGRIDADGYADHRLRAARVPLAPIANYFINTPSAELLRGEATDVDVRAYAFPGGGGGGGGGAYHLSGVAHVRSAAMHVPGLAVDATDMRGTIGAFDGGIVAPRLDARLGGLAVVLAGGIYGWHAPAFRLGVRSRGDLGTARGLFRFSRHLPLRGDATLSTLLEGKVGTPLVATRLGVPDLRYDRFPVSVASGRAVYYDGEVDVVGARATYGGLAVNADGSIVLGSGEPATQLAVGASGPARLVPYAAELAPSATLRATALLAGVGVRFDARGDAEGAGGGTTLAAPFHVDPLGDGAFGPIVVRRDDGRDLAGTFYLDRAHDASGFWLDARDFPFVGNGAEPRLPGIDLVAPAFAGRLDGAVAGVGPPSAFRLAGRVRARELRVGSVAIDDVTTNVAGAFGNLRLGRVAARGPWGRFAGAGTYAGGRLALAGRYAGSLEMLRAFTGDVGGTGALGGPVALLVDPHVSIVQTTGEHGTGTMVRGVPFDRLDATIAVADRRLRVYAATAELAGGGFAAAGALASADGIGVSVAGADAARMRGAPLERGRVAAIGSVSSAGGPARFDGGLAVSGGVAARVPLSGNGELTFAPGDLSFRRTDAEAAGDVLEARGRVVGAGAPGSVYDVALRFPSVGIGPLARAVGRGNVDGTARGDVRVRGSYARLRLDGDVEMPEGTIDGLAFANASARVSVARDGFRARRGRVTVGSTETAFSASYLGDDSAIRVVARHADLTDFNDLFDAGDTLGGRGRVAIRFVRRGHATRTNADIAIAGLRYRRFDLGDARANWTSHGRDVTGSVLFGGPSGRLAASGTLVLPVRARLPGLLLGSRFDGRAELQGLDLGVWLPALGYQVPVSGRVDANARIVGPLRNPAVTTVATLRDGSLGRFPVERFEFSASSTLERTTVRELDLELPSVSIVGSGTFGLAPRSPLALALHASSPNLGLLSARFFGASAPVTGSGSADLTVDGTRESPHVAGRVGVRDASVRGVALPQADAAFGLRGRDVVLRDTTVRFAAGSVSLAGYAPLEIAPLGVGPANAPVALDFTASDVELSDFAPLLPNGSTLRGRLDGHVTVGGTAATPRVGGLLELASGTLQSPYETVALTDATARLRFDGDAARLDAFHAAAGGGTLDASGSVRFADVLGFGPAAYDFVGRADKLRLDVPAYGTGSLDGTLSFTRLAGGRPAIAGDLRLSDGTIPFSALLLAGGGGGGGGFDTSAAPGTSGALPPLPHDVGFDLDVSAVKNVRVRSANVDIGARGDLHIAGSLDRPSLSGGFTSTGGTVTYFNTVFRLVRGTVAFEPDRGVVPTLDAVATTHVINPDPNTVRNAAGTADVSLTLSGPVTNLTIALRSDPAYERQQILGLLLNAPALGATNLFGETPGEATPYGSNSVAGLPGSVAASRSTAGEVSVAQEAFGVANAQFTRTLLAPFETTLAQAVGLSNFNVNVDYTGNVGLSARKILGKNVNAIYGTSFGYPYRQTFGFEIKQNDATAAQVTVFQTLGENGLSSQTPTTLLTSTGNPKYNAAQPSAGTAGFSLSIQHLF